MSRIGYNSVDEIEEHLLSATLSAGLFVFCAIGLMHRLQRSDKPGYGANWKKMARFEKLEKTVVFSKMV